MPICMYIYMSLSVCVCACLEPLSSKDTCKHLPTDVMVALLYGHECITGKYCGFNIFDNYYAKAVLQGVK